MNSKTPARGATAPAEHSPPSPSALSPYYEKGDQLRAKHLRSNLASGRRFERWALDLLPLRAADRVLDAGCGWGRFTWPLVDNDGLAAAAITCCDSSFGMLQTAAREAARRSHCPKFTAADIHKLPFHAGCFDGVMANHVLYHLSDIRVGIRELARVVKQVGWLLATTNSDEVSVPVLEFHYAALDELEVDYTRDPVPPSRWRTAVVSWKVPLARSRSFSLKTRPCTAQMSFWPVTRRLAATAISWRAPTSAARRRNGFHSSCGQWRKRQSAGAAYCAHPPAWVHLCAASRQCEEGQLPQISHW